MKCADCGREGHYAYRCLHIESCWTDAFGRMPYVIRMFQKNMQVEREFWESI